MDWITRCNRNHAQGFIPSLCSVFAMIVGCVPQKSYALLCDRHREQKFLVLCQTPAWLRSSQVQQRRVRGTGRQRTGKALV